MKTYAFGPAIADVFSQPQRVFQAIFDKTLSAWFPLLLIFIASLAIFGWYFTSVDMEQFVIAAAAQSGTPLNAETIAAVREQAGLIQATTIVSSVITQVGMPFVIALYCSLIANTVSERRSTYGQWLAVAAWSAIPGMVGMLSMAVSMLMAQDTLGALEALDRTSLNNLVLHLAPQDQGYVFANAVSIGSLWSWLVSVLGFRVLAQTRTGTAALIMAAPIVLILILIWLL